MEKEMKFSHTYTPNKDRFRPSTVNEEPTLTQKSDAKDADINVIMAKYKKTGQLPKVLLEPMYGDFSEMPDYRASVTAIQQAEEAFLQVPAKIRAQFGNDPGEFIKFATDPNNKDKLKEMGLLKPEAPPTIEEQTLTAIRELKPQETKPNGN